MFTHLMPSNNMLKSKHFKRVAELKQTVKTNIFAKLPKKSPSTRVTG